MAFLITQPGEGSQNYKTAVRAASSANVALTGSAPILLGGVTLANNDRVLLKDQSNAAENGIYEIAISSGSYVLTRAVDANSSREVVPNMLVPVSEGTYAEQLFQLTTDGPIVLDTTLLNFAIAVLPIDLTTGVLGVLPVTNGGTNKSSWTEGQVVFAGTSGSILTEDSEFNWDNSNKRLGIGTASPNSKVQINNSGTQMGLAVFSTSSNNTAEFYNQGTTNYTLALNSAADSAQTGASIGGYFARGTLGSRQQTLANDVLLSITASGHTGSAVAPTVSAGLVIAADQDTTASSCGGQVSIVTTPNNVVTSPVPRLTVKNNGHIGIGTITPNTQLHIYNPGISVVTLESGNSAFVHIASNSNPTNAPTFRFTRSRGSVFSKIPVLAGDSLGVIAGGGYYNSSAFSTAAEIRIIAAENFTSGTNAGHLAFATVPSLASVPVERMRITDIGNVVINSLTADRAIISDPSKNLVSSSVTSTELGFLSGVASSVQNQLDGKENKASVTRITKTANYNVAATDDYIGCDSATPAASFTLTLPDASTAYSGKRLIIKDEGGLCTSYNIIVNAAGGQTIDGSSSYTLNSNYESVTLICNGTDEWFII